MSQTAPSDFWLRTKLTLLLPTILSPLHSYGTSSLTPSFYSFPVPTSSEHPSTVGVFPRVPPLAVFSSPHSLWPPLSIFPPTLGIPRSKVFLLVSPLNVTSSDPAVCWSLPRRCITSTQSSTWSELHSTVSTLRIRSFVLQSPFWCCCSKPKPQTRTTPLLGSGPLSHRYLSVFPLFFIPHHACIHHFMISVQLNKSTELKLTFEPSY